MRTSDPEKRRVRGEYYITPWDKPEISPKDKKASWWVIGFRAWEGKNDRVRRRWSNYAAAEEFLKGLEEGDAKYLETHKQVSKPAVIVSKTLDETRLKEAQRAVALLPVDKNNDPDPRCRLDQGIEYALKCGWNPIVGNATVASLLPELEKELVHRNTLEWKEKKYLSDGGLEAAKVHIRACRLVFGAEPISEINSVQRQEKVLLEALDDAGKPVLSETKRSAMKGLSRLLGFLVEKEKLGIARVYKNGLKRTRIPQAMTILQQQEYLDEFWPTEFAAGAVARLWLGARPWSELKKTMVKETHRYGLSTDYRTFYAPLDGKTGWRPVEVPPIARLLFEQLDKEGRLSRERTPEGYHIIYVGTHDSWTYHYAKLGYLALPKFQTFYRRKGMSKQEMLANFRARYPLKYNAFVMDYPRHTNISAYLHLTNGRTEECATYHGNSRRIIDMFYRSLMARAEGFLHFRLFPCAVAHLFKREEIALPRFCTVTMDEEDKAEYNRLVATLPKVDTEEDRIAYAKQMAAKKKADYEDRAKKRNSTFAARRAANPDYFSYMKKANQASKVSRRVAALQRASRRIEALKAYLETHPEGFQFSEIRTILEAAGVPVPGCPSWIYKHSTPSGKTSRAAVFTHREGIYVLNEAYIEGEKVAKKGEAPAEVPHAEVDQ